MNEELYLKIIKVYKKLTNRFSKPRYSDYYKFYLRESWENDNEIWNGLHQFKNLPFKTFFRKEHIQQYASPEKYFDSNTFIINDNEISFHHDLDLVLYSYVAYQLIDELVKFREMIDSELDQKFGKDVNKDEYVFSYKINDHKNIYKYISDQIPNFQMLFDFLSTGNMIKIKGDYIEIKFKQIDNVINGLNIQYDFENVNFQ